jgi:hypothetical protein
MDGDGWWGDIMAVRIHVFSCKVLVKFGFKNLSQIALDNGRGPSRHKPDRLFRQGMDEFYRAGRLITDVHF